MPELNQTPQRRPSREGPGHQSEETQTYHPEQAARCNRGPEPECPGVLYDLADHPRYRVLELIGAGGMGCVYKAEHRFMGRLVALKVIHHRLVGQPEMVGRFRQEVWAAARLCHPNIVRAYDADQAGSTQFLVMELVEGDNLGQVAQERGRLDVAQACDYARQTALGLQHAFEQGMVHRDIKPYNLMLTADGVVKILDFGLARYVSEMVPHPVGAAYRIAAPGRRPDGAQPSEEMAPAPTDGSQETATPGYPQIGTADYMAPEEVLDARQADIRADIYSLGCTLYRFLTGRVPFPANTIADKMRAHLEEMPEPVGSLRPEVPCELAAVVRRMMDKRPQTRYQSPAEVAAALAPFVNTAHRKVLVVDDDPLVRQALARTLEGHGLGVACAANGQEALRLLAREPAPDLVLLDMVMPVMDGWQFLHHLKNEAAWAGIPVIILSAAEPSRASMAALDAVDYLQKPIPLDEIASRVRQHARAG